MSDVAPLPEAAPPTLSVEEALGDLGGRIVADSAGSAAGWKVEFDELTLTAQSGRIVELLTVLRDNPGYRFVQLTDLTAVDHPDRARRFDLVYQLLSFVHNARVRVVMAVAEDEPAPSVTGVYPNADWCEREVFDLFGVSFSGHPDLRRILTDYGFQGHPLRKDFPMSGYVELRYDEEQKRVVYEPVKLPAEFRPFDFMSPWEGVKYVIPGDEKATQLSGATGAAIAPVAAPVAGAPKPASATPAAAAAPSTGKGGQ